MAGWEFMDKIRITASIGKCRNDSATGVYDHLSIVRALRYMHYVFAAMFNVKEYATRLRYIYDPVPDWQSCPR